VHAVGQVQLHQVALDHATTVFPFKACGKFPGL
jgi:hypothetical protein